VRVNYTDLGYDMSLHDPVDYHVLNQICEFISANSVQDWIRNCLN